MKFIIYFLLYTTIHSASESNSNIRCQPKITKITAEQVQAELDKLQNQTMDPEPENNSQENKILRDRILSLKQTKKVILDKDGSQAMIYNADRQLNSDSDKNRIRGQYQIDLECVSEGPNFKIFTTTTMRCNDNLPNFSIKYSARKKNETGDKFIDFAKRMQNDNKLEAEVLSHTFTSKEIVSITVDEEKCEIRANSAIIIRITFILGLIKLILN